MAMKLLERKESTEDWQQISQSNVSELGRRASNSATYWQQANLTFYKIVSRGL
jgi:predicted transcriptional regulator